MRSFVVYRDEGSTHYFVVEYVAAKSVPTRHNVGASWSKLAQEHIPTMARTRLVLKTPPGRSPDGGRGRRLVVCNPSSWPNKKGIQFEPYGHALKNLKRPIVYDNFIFHLRRRAPSPLTPLAAGKLMLIGFGHIACTPRSRLREDPYLSTVSEEQK